MLINDKVDAVYIPDSPSRIKATDYNQIKNEIQECITEAGLTPTKDVIQLPQALKILTAQSGAEEVAKIEAAGQEQLNAINTAGAQAVQKAQDAAATATSKAAEAADSASTAASSASAASGSASTAATQATNASASAELAQKWATQTTAEVVSGQGYGAKYYADQAADSASSANTSASTATTKATEASASASAAAQSAQEAASSANLADIQNKITNCITKIPQDINLVLSEGTLTLKAGSKVYDGNGLLHTLTEDSGASISYSSGQHLFIYEKERNTLLNFRPSAFGSGDTLPENTSNTYNMFYLTTDKKVYRWLNRAWTASAIYSLPICAGTGNGTQIISIDQVFNGFGYIGQTLFALPGVSGLIPNGRNADGTLNNTAVTVSSLQTLSFSGQTKSVFGLTTNSLFSSDNAVYNAVDNKNYNPITGNRLVFCNCGTVETDSTGVITSLNPKTTFHAVDYSDYETKVSKSGDTMTGALKVPTPVAETNDTTVPTTAWVRNLLQQEKTKLMGIPNTKAGVAFSQRYTVPSNGIIVITGTKINTASGSKAIRVNGSSIYTVTSGSKGESVPMTFPVLDGDSISIDDSGSSISGTFFPYL